MGYESFYHLREHPFSFAADDKFYYDSPQHSKALLKLYHAVETEKGLALLVGDIGTGKTTLSRRLLDQLISQEIEATLLVIIYSEITSLWFLKKIALMLEAGSDSEDKIEIITSVYHRLLEFTQKRKKVVILIDEANMLRSKEIMEEIRGLLNLESEHGKLLNFILFGLPDTEDYLKKAKKLIIVENNVTGQFAKLLKLNTSFDIRNKILKFTGMPFSVEELEEKIKKIVEEK